MTILNQREELSLVEKGDYYKLYKNNVLRRCHDTYKSIENFNVSTKCSLKKQLRSLLTETDYNIFNLNHTQEKFINKYKEIDDIKHKMFINEYKDHLEHIKNNLKKTNFYQNEQELLKSEAYINAKEKLKIRLIKRFQLDHEAILYIDNDTPKIEPIRISHFNTTSSIKNLNTAPLPSILHSSNQNDQNKNFQIKKKKKVDFILPKIKSAISNNTEDNIEEYKVSFKKRLSLPAILKKPNEVKEFKAYKIDSESNLIEITAPQRKEFQLHFEKLREFKIRKNLENEKYLQCTLENRVKEFNIEY